MTTTLDTQMGAAPLPPDVATSNMALARSLAETASGISVMALGGLAGGGRTGRGYDRLRDPDTAESKLRFRFRDLGGAKERRQVADAAALLAGVPGVLRAFTLRETASRLSYEPDSTLPGLVDEVLSRQGAAIPAAGRMIAALMVLMWQSTLNPAAESVGASLVNRQAVADQIIQPGYRPRSAAALAGRACMRARRDI